MILSCFLYVAARLCWRLEGAIGLKTLTSKNALSYRPPQKPLAAICSLAPSSVTAEAPVMGSPVIGCSVGSMQTSLHTSDSQHPTVPRTSLCLIEGKPPFGQESECSTVKLDPQAQLVGTLDGSHPYIPQGQGISEGALVE